MGEVWRAVDEVLNRPVAVKLLRLDLAPDEAFKARFRAEARTAAGLSHGGIAAVFDYGEAMGSAYLVMELVPGEPLSAMIAREGALGTDKTLLLVSQAARALHAAHRHGVVHRDIKPANLMVTPELRVKITDFGISRPRDHEPLTATGQVMGTAHYLAPELARGEVASPLSDVYALGVVTYECLAGWRPFEGENQVAVATAHLQEQPPPLPDTVPAAIRRLVQATMAKRPADRPQGADVLAAALEDLRLRRLATTQAVSAPLPTQPTARPRPTAAFAGPPGAAGAPMAGASSAGSAPAPGPPAGYRSSSPRTAPMPGVGGAADGHGESHGGSGGSQHRGGGLSRRIVFPLMALVLVAALAVAGVLLVNRNSSSGSGSGSTATGTTRPAATASQPVQTTVASVTLTSTQPTEETGTAGGTVTVRKSRLVGRDVDDVTDELEAAGLEVDRHRVNSVWPEDTVLNVSPTGEVEQGTTITLTVSRGPKKGG